MIKSKKLRVLRWGNLQIIRMMAIWNSVFFAGLYSDVKAAQATNNLTNQVLTILPATGACFQASDGAEIYFIASNRKNLKKIQVFENDVQIGEIGGSEKVFLII